jgi:hypothetical protein
MMVLKKADVVRWNLNKVEKSETLLLAGVAGKNPEHRTFHEFLTQPLRYVMITKYGTIREKRNSIFLTEPIGRSYGNLTRSLSINTPLK